jgi:hypothetical protein
MRKLLNTLFVFHLSYHIPFVIRHLFSEDVFQSVDTFSRDKRDYFVCELEMSAKHLRCLPWCSLDFNRNTSSYGRLLDDIDRLVLLLQTRTTRQLATLPIVPYPPRGV